MRWSFIFLVLCLLLSTGCSTPVAVRPEASQQVTLNVIGESFQVGNLVVVKSPDVASWVVIGPKGVCETYIDSQCKAVVFAPLTAGNYDVISVSFKNGLPQQSQTTVLVEDEQSPDPPTVPDQPGPPNQPDQPQHLSQVMYLYQRDQGAIPAGVMGALAKINETTEGVITVPFEVDQRPITERFSLAYKVGVEFGVPCLVVVRGDKAEAVKVETYEDVMEVLK